MVIQCKNLISLYILPDQRRENLLVSFENKAANTSESLNKALPVYSGTSIGK